MFVVHTYVLVVCIIKTIINVNVIIHIYKIKPCGICAMIMSITVISYLFIAR